MKLLTCQRDARAQWPAVTKDAFLKFDALAAYYARLLVRASTELQLMLLDRLREVLQPCRSSSPSSQCARLRGHLNLMLCPRVGAQAIRPRRAGARAVLTLSEVYAQSLGHAAHFVGAVYNCSSVGPSISSNFCESSKRTRLVNGAA
ncbi:hypothetical protein EXIGLDRAFT_773465 [Exidia glandulosa HHB12029]|uniref:Uncharacterized protein n=1 Tax=Exidia glandulosa HHB12029 TaxID=1314781 RepID=A0A166A137_EXIGL|nr:hypothetical protein EXIGLDRAFT_773465 [Exidia glandulosa HHB12029]